MLLQMALFHSYLWLSSIPLWDLIKFIRFCTAKETKNKTKRQPTEWENKFANDAVDKDLNLQNIQTAHTTQQQKNKQPNEKWAEDLN